ncbi:Sec-independent protein translocase subunit TatA [Gandjariella thermophila]|uniref:Sec-independent protein translocase protein TatA n=1 Tax=Gandjariella thermophila TaxID=1931992 RepID=A0A4D4JAI1_9PSEU|nr:Sec-independent protein translocase subunit TatA [Gandjariella thermophila]GDY33825.1 Sec-independent protein translocase protein TatA [Gandjariella thermophila]
MLNGLSPTHLLIVLAIFVLLFGARRLPDAARGVGRSLRIFRSEIKASDGESHSEDATKKATERDDASRS